MAIKGFTHIATSSLLAWLPVISADGRFLATNTYRPAFFIDPAFKGADGVVVVDLATGQTHQVSPAARTGASSDPNARVYGIDGDGSTVLFMSSGPKESSMYLEEANGSAITLVCPYPDGTAQFGGRAYALSADGRHLALQGIQLDHSGKWMLDGLFLLDLRTGAATIIGADPYGGATVNNPVANQLSISSDGRYVVYDSYRNSEVFRMRHDLFVYDAVTGETKLVNTRTDGSAGDGVAHSFSISGNGRYVAFEWLGDNLSTGRGDGSTLCAVYVKDLLTGAVVMASADARGQSTRWGGEEMVTQGISDDGRYVVFVSTDSYGYQELEALNRQPGMSSVLHVFVKDMVTGAVTLVNSTPETIGLDAHGAAIAGKGQVIVFQGVEAVNEPALHPEFHTYALPMPGFSPVTVNDVLKGSTGADTLAGGLGDDEYFVDNRSDIVLEYAGQGRDTVHSSVDYALPANVEALFIEGSASASITGNELDNVLVGNAASNVLRGGAGDDILEGGGGSDSLFGDAGNDTARFGGKLADYTITGGAVTNVLSKPSGPTAGITTLASIETLLFIDATVTLVTEGIPAQAYRLYQAAFDRKPDLAGLGFWMAQMEKGMNLVSVAAQFVQSDEFKELFGQSPSNASFVNLLYQHVLHRAADEQGAAFWTGVLDRHAATAAEVLAQFSESPENQAALIGVITNGIAYQPYHG